MTHELLMQHAVALAQAFVVNGDLRHDGCFVDDGRSNTQEQVRLLLIQMYRAVEHASFEGRQGPEHKRVTPPGSS